MVKMNSGNAYKTMARRVCRITTDGKVFDYCQMSSFADCFVNRSYAAWNKLRLWMHGHSVNLCNTTYVHKIVVTPLNTCFNVAHKSAGFTVRCSRRHQHRKYTQHRHSTVHKVGDLAMWILDWKTYGTRQPILSLFTSVGWGLPQKTWSELPICKR